MNIKTRVNQKTEYKARYYFMRDGKKRDSQTSWVESPEKADYCL